MPPQRWTTVLRYRFTDQESQKEQTDRHFLPALRNDQEGNVVDEGNDEAELPLSFNFVVDERDREEDEGEAEVPRPFGYIESQDVQETQIIPQEQHKSGPLPRFYSFEDPPSDLSSLPPLDYYNLDPTVDPVRLLVVLPHFGDPYSTVQCNLFPVSFQQHHYCYAAVLNTRGNKTLTSDIIVNCELKQVTRNLEVFLHHFRHKNVAKTVWIREICIYPGDHRYHQTPEWRAWIVDKACKVINMPDLMERLQDSGVLEKEKKFTVRQKDWTKVIRDTKLPTHYPIPLRTFTDEQLKSDESSLPRVPHEYVPLDLVAEEIRLVVLLPSSDISAPLIAHFAHESIYGTVVYQCLSYTWGSREKTAELNLNGQIFHITQNLDEALRGIRDKINMSVFWIDAICIDQENLQERNRQIPRMHQIYEMADAVLVWLGNADGVAELAMEFIDELGRPEWTAFEGDTEVKLKWSPRLARCWAALYRLLLRPYFRRLWVVQEIAVASVPTVFCGSRGVSWENLHHAALRLMMYEQDARKMCKEFEVQFDADDSNITPLNDDKRCQDEAHPRKDISLSHRMSYHRQMNLMQKPLSFLFLALLNRDAECVDDRDKIYALWNLANDAKHLTLTPDYALSVHLLYVTFAKQYIQHHESLDITCAPQVHCKGPLGNGKYLPSWAPDWRARSHVNSYLRPEELPIAEVSELSDLDTPMYCAAGTTKAIASFFDNDELLVCAGMVLDQVVHVSGQTDGPIQWYELAKKHCHHDGTSLSEEQVNRDFWSMLYGDPTSSWSSDGEGKIIACANTSRSILRKTATILPSRAIRPTMRGRKLVISKKGYMGLAPSWVKVGNELAVLLGCSLPVVLGRHGNHYHLEGDCFVQGWMRGEMLRHVGDGIGEGEGGDKIENEVAGNWPPIQIR
jgi:hypothetical protein